MNPKVWTKNFGVHFNCLKLSWKKVAMTYSPTNVCSTIGAVGLNFSVRDGKRWIPDAINRLNKWPFIVQISYISQKLFFTLCGLLFLTAEEQLNKYWRYSSKLHPKGAKKSFRAISTARLNVLPHLHLQPINVVVYDDPQWKSNLVVGFALRCFQRLSRPDADTRRCSWRNNRYTGGRSITVLSY